MRMSDLIFPMQNVRRSRAADRLACAEPVISSSAVDARCSPPTTNSSGSAPATRRPHRLARTSHVAARDRAVDACRTLVTSRLAACADSARASALDELPRPAPRCPRPLPPTPAAPAPPRDPPRPRRRASRPCSRRRHAPGPLVGRQHRDDRRRSSGRERSTTTSTTSAPAVADRAPADALALDDVGRRPQAGRVDELRRGSRR